ncbi:MAG: GatB/YqeY domain-containing protein [Bacteroidota bacterium]|jgi:uncharacterized protein YqeY
MSLEEQINADIKAAMLAKESAKLEALRAVKSAILLLKTSADGSAPDAELKALQKMVKQRKETAEIYTSQSRGDLAEVELFQAAIIEQYLPKQLSGAELEEQVKAILVAAGVSGAAEMGKAIGMVNKALAGKAEGKAIADMVKKLLT